MYRLLREAKLFDAKLGPIDGAGNVGAYLIGLVVSKQVAQPVQTKPEANLKTSEEKQEKPEEPAEKPKADAS
jgi:vacuolar protein sorting-associated protein 54